MKKLFIVGALIALTAVAQPFRAAVTTVTAQAQPARGGDARLLVSHPATESRPLFSPDGKRIAFTSTRSGGGDVYVLTLATGDLARLTFDDANELVSGWSPDSRAI